MIFIDLDLSKAFYTVNRELLYGVLTKFGCPLKLLGILREFHVVMVARVIVSEIVLCQEKVCTGVRQGDVLAQVLFNILLDA